MIAIIAAMDVEVNAFKELMTNLYEDEHRFIRGKIGSKDVVLAQSGVGKVGASIITTSLCNFYNPSLIINIGSAGGLTNDLSIGDVVIASAVAHHDIFVPGWPKGFDQSKTCYKVDSELLNRLNKMDLKPNVHIGPMVSGDSFICKVEQTTSIINDFPEALCVEMEASAVGQCASYFKVPFLILRSISDITIKEGNEVDFEEFVAVAAKNSAAFTVEVIDSL